MKLSALETPEYKARQKLYKLGGYDFHRMKLYMNDMRSMLILQGNKIAKEHKQELLKYPQQAQMIDEVYYRKIDDTENNFVGLLLNSALVMSASIFEVMFKRVCAFAAYKTHKKFVEPRQRVNEGCKTFIESCGINLSEIDEHWNRIDMGLQVRHLITHAGGTFPHEKKVFDPKIKEVINHIRSNEYISVKRPRSKKAKHFSIRDRLYVIDFLDVCSDYLIWIIMQLPERRSKRSKV